MKSKAVPSFWEGFERLPVRVQAAARKQYELWLKDPYHPSVRYKRIGNFWSARVTGSYRALGVMDGDIVIWFFIGTHDDYEKLLS